MKRALIACFGWASVALADDVTEAKRLFEEGRKLVEQGNLAEACKQFARSFELDRAAGTMLNLGDCAESEGRPRRAFELYDTAAKEFERTAQPERAKFARNRANTVLANYPELAREDEDKRERAEQERAAREAKLREQREQAEQARAAGAAARRERDDPGLRSGGFPTTPRRNMLPFKVVAVTALGLAAAGGAVWAHAYYGTIKPFEDGRGPVGSIAGDVITQEDCGASPSDERFQSNDPVARQGARDFFETCKAWNRTKWAIPVTIGFGVVGIGAFMYVLASPDPARPGNVSVTPTVSPDGAGATLRIDW
jgi:hypothetical protein